ncbi:MAG TPA: cell division protein FtsK, partial [Gammaproteobacteria bacterium]|nr:cell division protein FtsK [Gammaproteobacteria bacterium]
MKEGAFIALIATALFLTLALISFDRNDPGWTYTGSDETVNNIVGLSGAWIADVFLFFFGFLSYLFPMMLAWQAWTIFRERETETEFNWPIFIFRGVGLSLTVGAGTAIAAMHFYISGLDYQYGSGGIIGSEIADLLIPVFSY